MRRFTLHASRFTLMLCIALPLLAGCQSMQGTTSSGPTDKTMKIDGTTLHYVEQGSGTPVIFLHGAFSDHRVWESQRQAVAAKHRFIGLTMRYFGTAPWTDSGAQFSMATHVADVAAFIRELKVGPVVLVGQSYGSQIAAIVAAHHPELVRALFLNEPPLGTAMTSAEDRAAVAEDTKGLAAVRDAAKAGNINDATRLFFDFVNVEPGSFEKLPAGARAVHLDNARTIPVQFSAPPPVQLTCEQLGTLKIPVTITKGELTRTFFRILADNTNRCIPASQLITIKGAWHGAPRQQPAAFNEALLAFLARV